MSYNIFPSDGDTITEAEWTTILDRGNLRDYVERGLTVSLNGDGTIDIGAGLAFIRDASTNQTYPVEDESGTAGVQLADTSTTNYVYLTFDPSASDVEGSVEYHVDTDQTPPAGQPSLLIATADESTSTVTPRNPEPSVTAESVAVTGSTDLPLSDGSDLTSNRSLDTVYQNTTGEMIYVYVRLDVSADGTQVGAHAGTAANSGETVSVGNRMHTVDQTLDSGDLYSLQLWVPDGNYYQVNQFSGGGNVTAGKWSERQMV